MEIKITDENAKININYADANRLRSLFLYAGIPDDAITELHGLYHGLERRGRANIISPAPSLITMKGLQILIKPKICSLLFLKNWPWSRV